ncbi:MAG: PQQ-dependent sugar dehydrogenase [Flavobacteriaceae bacterium]
MTSQSQDLDLELVASGFNSPLEIKHAGDDRLFIVEQGGVIKILNSDGSVNATPFLDITSQVTSGGERGLLGLAFHPNYTSNGFFYVNYTNTGGNTQISRFSVSSNPDVADPASELQMLSFNQPASNHNGGHLAFGPDGMLYVASGDGGGGNDQNGQELTTLLGKILRLDVDLPSPYIPADNPFVSNSAVLDEIWASGLRNPWKFSFDEVTGDLWIADVGEFSWEEINKEPSTAAGLNYGWRCYEASSPYNTSGCPPAGQLTFPFAEYARSGSNCSVTGGYVYRGTEFPLLQGKYVFADFCSGDISTIDASGNITFEGNFGVEFITSFGVDVDDNLYLTSFGNDAVYIVIDKTFSLLENDHDFFTLFPNPATNRVNLKASSKPLSSYEIFDLKGRLITSGELGDSIIESIDVSQFQSGFYLVSVVSSEGNKQIKKLIKI